MLDLRWVANEQFCAISLPKFELESSNVFLSWLFPRALGTDLSNGSYMDFWIHLGLESGIDNGRGT
jgi:hypothetical protein